MLALLASYAGDSDSWHSYSSNTPMPELLDKLWSVIQPYDFVMLVILLGATLFGAAKGMAWQVASLASMFLSGATALRFYDQAAPYFGSSRPWNQLAAMLALYIGTNMAIWLMFRIVAGAIDRVRLKEFDRQVGAVFGAFKGAALCVIITFFAVTLSTTSRDTVLRSRSGIYIAQIIDGAQRVLPDDVHEMIGPYLQRLERELDPLDHEYRDRRANQDPGDPNNLWR